MIWPILARHETELPHFMNIEKQSIPPVVDKDFLASRTSITDSFLRNLIEVFNFEVPKLITKLKRSYRENDFESVKNLGHKLRGMSLNLGAMSLSEIGREIEEADPERVEISIVLLDPVFEKTKQELSQFAGI